MCVRGGAASSPIGVLLPPLRGEHARGPISEAPLDRWTTIESIAIVVLGALIAVLLWGMFAGNASEESRSVQPAAVFLSSDVSI